MPGEIKWEAVGREISEEEETGARIEGGSASRSRGAGCRGQLFPFGFLASGVRNEHGDGAGFGIVSPTLTSQIARNRFEAEFQKTIDFIRRDDIKTIFDFACVRELP